MCPLCHVQIAHNRLLCRTLGSHIFPYTNTRMTSCMTGNQSAPATLGSCSLIPFMPLVHVFCNKQHVAISASLLQMLWSIAGAWASAQPARSRARRGSLHQSHIQLAVGQISMPLSSSSSSLLPQAAASRTFHFRTEPSSQTTRPSSHAQAAATVLSTKMQRQHTTAVQNASRQMVLPQAVMTVVRIRSLR